jgi:hypothetical protein
LSVDVDVVVDLVVVDDFDLNGDVNLVAAVDDRGVRDPTDAPVSIPHKFRINSIGLVSSSRIRQRVSTSPSPSPSRSSTTTTSTSTACASEMNGRLV